ncbi:MAG TPA: right-handed parallel beta-helix repeat-containing protein [Planctomycetota bacterium]
MAALKLILPLVLLSLPATAGRDWFVREGSTGDGTKDKPFGDPWEALEKCEAGDAIHIAGGRYVGKLQTGQWTILFDGVKLIGGYSADFSKRDPWTNHSKLVYDRNSKNYPKDARIWVNPAKDVTLDGLVIDVAEQNQYDADPPGRAPRSLDSGEAAVRVSHASTIRNCVFLNTGREAIVTQGGSVIENNLFMNTFDTAVKVNGTATAPVTTIKNNTFVWSWCDRAPGKGRYSGAGIQMGAPCNITGNIFAHMDNNAIYCTIKPEKTSIQNNVFSMNLWSNFKMFLEGRDVAVDDKSMELLEEAGLKAFEGNEVANPELPLDPAWLDGTAKRSAGTKGKVSDDDWNKYRQLMGLPMVATGGTPPSGIAPQYALDKAILLMTPKKAGLKAGARILPLEAKFADASAAGPTKAYDKAEIGAWAGSPASVNGKSIEMVVAISSVANVGGLPAEYKKDDHEGIFLHDQMGNVRVTGFYKKGSNANRVVNEGAGLYNGSGKADRLYVVKGVAYEMKSVPKAGFFIESIQIYEAAAVAKKRALGRDWFVRAGATGGNGSKEKPFRDPFQALEKCEAGDFIHVATGEYGGKLKMGYWKVEMPDISLLGGYNADFTARDPWKTPTLLYTPADFKGARNNMTIEGAEDHSGTILDGFVFDKKLNNLYQPNGDLMYSQSEKKEHVWLSKPDCVIRNCVFVNGSEGAIRVHGGQTVENCIFLNHYSRAVRVQQGIIPEQPFYFRNNTVAFAWEPKFGEGKRQGDLLVLGSTVRAVVDNNIFEFADNHALRVDALPKDIELTNNVFAHNLYAEVYRTLDVLFIDAKNWASLRELGWKKLEGNELLTPGLPLDQKWFDVYMNRTAMVPGKVTMDDWNKLRSMMGQPVIATGGQAGTGVAPAYDWKKALELFPKNPACKAGARPVPLTVKFEGIVRSEEAHEYAETTWDVAKSAPEWEKLDGKRVMLKVAIKSGDNQYLLPEVKKEERSAWQVSGPLGTDSGGLPMRVYVQRGTRHERVFNQAKGHGPGKPEETHIIKGVAKPNRQMLIEAVERAD